MAKFPYATMALHTMIIHGVMLKDAPISRIPCRDITYNSLAFVTNRDHLQGWQFATTEILDALRVTDVPPQANIYQIQISEGPGTALAVTHYSAKHFFIRHDLVFCSRG